MNHRSFRDELRSAFDEMTGPPHPALAAQIRDELVTRPARARGLRLAAVLAAALALIVVVGLLTTQRLGVQVLPKSPVPAGQHTSSPSASPSPAPVVPPVTAGATASPGFTCSAASGGGTGQAKVTAVRVTAVRAAAQSGYDRFVIQFDGPVPQYELHPQPGSTFVQDPSGLPVTLQGSSGLALTLRDASSSSYSGPTDLHTNGNVLREARQVGDFEGVVSWALGLSKPACYRVTTLSSPFRLVIDVQG
jgi:hypothetical protein